MPPHGFRNRDHQGRLQRDGKLPFCLPAHQPHSAYAGDGLLVSHEHGTQSDFKGAAIMRSRTVPAAIALIMLPSALTVARSPHSTPLRLSPAQAVMNAAEMTTGVGGVFEMVVRATGRQGRFLYLNSEADYRDPRNLTIVITREEESALADRLGHPFETNILRKVIAVRGVARKTRIDFLADGRLTGKYYFQTHLNLRSARDLTVEGERPIP